jgi:hypothetical protein
MTVGTRCSNELQYETPQLVQASFYLAMMTEGSPRILRQPNETRFQENAAPLPRGVLDHLFDHLSVRVHGVPCGLTEPRESANRLSTGLYGGSWGSRGPYMS